MFTLLSGVLCLSSCVDGSFYEKDSPLTGRSWSHENKQKFEVNITDNSAKYDVFITVRHSPSYKFANLYLLLHEQGVGLKDTAYRKEIILAQPDGRWIGHSAGGLYEIERIAKDNFSFPDTGKYVFEIEQNMRDNPLKEIVDVGIKILKK